MLYVMVPAGEGYNMIIVFLLSSSIAQMEAPVPRTYATVLRRAARLP